MSQYEPVVLDGAVLPPPCMARFRTSKLATARRGCPAVLVLLPRASEVGDAREAEIP